MAVLSEQNRVRVWIRWMMENREALGITKADIRAAVDAIDNWVDANGASFNTAIPQPARGSLTMQQKAHLLFFVVEQRFIGG